MNCKFCNGENADDAVFCTHCGKRVDGTETAEATTNKAAPAAAPAVATATEQQPLTGWKKTVWLIGTISGLVGAIISVIFVFLIGMTPYMTVGGTKIDAELLGDDIGDVIGIKWFYGDALNGLGDKLQAGDGGSAFAYALKNLFPAMFGSLIFNGIIITVFVLTIIAIIRYAKGFSKKPAKGVEKITVAIFLTYAMGAAWIKALFVLKSSSDGLSMGYAYNGATIAGLVLGAVTVSLLIASRIAVKGKEVIKRNSILKLSFAAAGIVFTAVVWALATDAIGGIKGDDASTTYGFIPMIGAIAETNVESLSTEVAKNFAMVAAAAMLGQFLLFAVVPISFAVVGKNLYNVHSNEKKSTLAASICLVIFSLFLMSVAVLGVNNLCEFANNRYGVGFSKIYTGAIVVLVMAVLNLGVSIADKVCAKKFAE